MLWGPTPARPSWPRLLSPKDQTPAQQQRQPEHLLSPKDQTPAQQKVSERLSDKGCVGCPQRCSGVQSGEQSGEQRNDAPPATVRTTLKFRPAATPHAPFPAIDGLKRPAISHESARSGGGGDPEKCRTRGRSRVFSHESGGRHVLREPAQPCGSPQRTPHQVTSAQTAQAVAC